MTRLEKKCMVFSVGLHGLLAVILLASAGFGSNPPQTDLQVLTLIPANIVDRAGAGGGTPVPSPSPQLQRQPQPEPAPQTVQTEQVERVQVPTPPQRKETTRPLPEPDDSKDVTLESKPKTPKPSTHHEVQVSYTPANAATSRKKPEKTSSSETPSTARAEARRLKEIENSLAELASGVRSSGSPNTVVDVEGIGGGEAFAGYREVVKAYYYRAWVAPDNMGNRLATADARVTIARDGSVISAELARPSGDSALDKSVERVLRDVTKLRPFPASTHDTQRTFSLRFSPEEAKEIAG
jgi:periplasmic protein TonB